MKKNEVPQDDSPLKNHKSNELVYAVDDDGKFVSVQSTGWEAKTVVQHENLEVLDQRIKQALNNVKAGIVSPIVYFMELNRMDWQTLAAYVGKWTFFVKRHSKPNIFKKLSTKTLQKYADAFGISLNDLQNFKG
ncbi:hypothetical protein NU10_00065 [Flavobacterium dauae]|uniref:hypothetical protein n=1 Tax=Flavobacterium dauae TaxID=1563479 RepID=UPI00101B508E|nr:hypothetical protein [Flavobacterium dauae]WLD23828.1 hypothetical protein NU10_00065 [Flavobacterium dauae]